MNNAAFIEDWNSIIPFKIKASDLESPTEHFLFKCVLNIFKLMHYDVSSYENMFSEPIEKLTMRRVEFVTRINYIYQLCSDSKQTSFFYVDLVKPTAKKVKHLLKILLNYLFYINMVKETVLEKANHCTEKYFELNAKLNQEQILKEANKIKVSNMDRDIDKMKNRLPMISQQIEELHETQKSLRGKLALFEVKDHELGEKVIRLKMHHLHLSDKKITDDEAVALIEKNESLEQEMGILTEKEKQLQETNVIHVESINQIRPCVGQIEKLLQTEFDGSYISLRAELEELTLEYDKTQGKKANMECISEGLAKTCEKIEAYIAEKRNELTVRNKVLGKSEKKEQNKLQSLTMELQQLTEAKQLFVEMMEKGKMDLEKIVAVANETLYRIDPTNGKMSPTQ
ncbi:sarcolemmal associated protein [Anopheles darlingi]|uniref:Sarcolemmal associated protein n=1 Tax=Anopheles darlingi TaxID=43151 RepID=W5JFT6_ANODA|nr:sarcolemmal associated protein [Anopheles darlingi]